MLRSALDLPSSGSYPPQPGEKIIQPRTPRKTKGMIAAESELMTLRSKLRHRTLLV
jgi:hypothetical protein